uniref:involucrin-like n=1 Tax=Scatophagus argus TaxID=75038 RepID=UPI001ED83AE4|nr:involucrin-like [Scatophagus argus]
MVEHENRKYESQMRYGQRTEEMVHQRKTERSERDRKLQMRNQIVADNLAASNKDQATAMALKEEQRLAKDVAKIDAKDAERLKQKKDERAAMHQSISASNQSMIGLKKQREQDERQLCMNQLQMDKNADGLFMEETKVKAQKTKENNIQVSKFNANMASQKQAHLQQLKREEHEAEARNAEQTAMEEKQFQQRVQHDLHKASEKLQKKRGELQNLQLSNKKTTHLPPISKERLTVKGQTCLSSSPDDSEVQVPSTIAPYPCLPPISKAVNNPLTAKVPATGGRRDRPPPDRRHLSPDTSQPTPKRGRPKIEKEPQSGRSPPDYRYLSADTFQPMPRRGRPKTEKEPQSGRSPPDYTYLSADTFQPMPRRGRPKKKRQLQRHNVEQPSEHRCPRYNVKPHPPPLGYKYVNKRRNKMK